MSRPIDEVLFQSGPFRTLSRMLLWRENLTDVEHFRKKKNVLLREEKIKDLNEPFDSVDNIRMLFPVRIRTD